MTKIPKNEVIVTNRGRPSSYTPEIAEAICDWVAEGKALCDFCKQEGMPSVTSVGRWEDANDDFRIAYARARMKSADKLADEIIKIADDDTKDANSRRVMVDARKWVAAKLKPQSYGDKVDMNLTGSMDVRNLTDEQVKTKLAAKLHALLSPKY